jgi:putative intracellular protease/amidase
LVLRWHHAKVQLRKWYEEGANIAGSCIGTFILAEAGLLDNAEATTTWWLAPLFRQRYPKTRLDESRSGLDVEAIAAEVGYSGGHTLRMLLRERLGRGVR